MIDERLAHKKRAWIELRDELIRLLATEAGKRAFFNPIIFAGQLDDGPPKYDEIPGGGGGANLWNVSFVKSVWVEQVEQVHKDEEELEKLARQRAGREQASNQQHHHDDDLNDESEAESASNAGSGAHSQEGLSPVPPNVSSNASNASNVSLDVFAPLSDTSSSSESNNLMDEVNPSDKAAVLDDLNWVSLTSGDMAGDTS